MSTEVKYQMEAMYSREDPWNFKNAPMEVERYERMLDALPKKDYKWMLEIGCAEGVFTEKLYERFKPLGIIGVDISARAVKRATENYYKKYNHKLYFYELDIEEYGIVGHFDVIYLSEVLYLLKKEKVEEIIQRLSKALNSEGYLIVVNNWIRDWHGTLGVEYNKIIEKYLVKEDETKYSHEWKDPWNHKVDSKPYPAHYYSIMRFKKE